MVTVSEIGRKFYKVEGACVDISFLVLGAIDNNTYIIGNGESTLVVDPSCEAEKILEALGTSLLDGIILTHYHYDHVGAARELRDATGAMVFASEIDAEIIENPEKRRGNTALACPVDRKLVSGEEFVIGSLSLEAIYTPGHTHGEMCFSITSGNHPEGFSVLIAGDVLFNGAIGRTDFEDGSMDEMRASLAELAKLPDETLVLPGHNNLTTIGAERKRIFARYC